jgi:thiol-disulfide isomerase/thioredoxin
MRKNVKKLLTLSFACVFTFLVVFANYQAPYKVYASNGGDFIPSPSPVIVERFTGGWCGACPYASAGMHYAEMVLNETEDVFIPLAFHYRDSLASADTEKRADYYSINSYPSVVVGGIDLIVGVPNDGQYLDFDQYVAAILECQNQQRILADIQLTGDFDDHVFQVKVKAREDFGKRNINIIAVIYQDWVITEQANGEYMNRYVVQKMPYGVTGKPVRLKADQIYDEERKFVLTTKAAAQSGIVVFLQDQDTKEIVGSALHKFSDERPALFYWNIPQMGLQQKHTSLDIMTYKVDNTRRLKKLLVRLMRADDYYTIESARLPDSIADKATIEFSPRKGEITVLFDTPFTGSGDLFELLVNFKKDTGDSGVIFKIIQFSASDDQGEIVPFELIDLSFFSGLKVVPNMYDLDKNGTVDDSDVVLLGKSFGTMRGDKGFMKEADFNDDRRIDLYDINHLMLNEDWRIRKLFP